MGFLYVAPTLDGDTRVSGICPMGRSLVVLRILLADLQTREPEAVGDAMLTDEEWQQSVELLAVAAKVEEFNTLVQNQNAFIGPMGLMLRVRLASCVHGTFSVINWRAVFKAGMSPRRLPSKDVKVDDFVFVESKHIVRRLQAQILLRLSHVTDDDLLSFVWCPRAKAFMWNSAWTAEAAKLFGDMKKLRRRAKQLMVKSVMELHKSRFPGISASLERQQANTPTTSSQEDKRARVMTARRLLWSCLALALAGGI